MTSRLAIVTSHPIQYQAPLFRLLQERGNVEPVVFFLSDHGLEPSFDPGLGHLVRFDVPLTGGYTHLFVPNRAPRPSISAFFGAVHPGLVRAMRSGGFDAVLVLGYAQASDWIAYAAAALCGIPIILRGETPDPPETAKRTLKWRLKKVVLSALVRHSAACAALGLANGRYYASLGARSEHLFFAPYSVDNDAFRSGGLWGRDHRNELLVSVGLDPSRPVVLYTGKLVARKRPLDVIAAVKQLDGAAQLIIVGDGPMVDEVRAAVLGDPGIALLGFVNQSELPKWYGVSEIFILPSDYEVWGLVVNEAMAAGAIPVVSDSVGCGPDLVDQGAGRIFRTGDIDGLAACLRDLLEDHAQSPTRLEAAARIDRYNLASTAQGIEDAVDAVVGKRMAR